MSKIIKINKLSHCVVENVEKKPIFDTEKKERVLLQDKTSGNVMYVNINDAIIKTFLLDYGYEVSNKSNINKSTENSNVGLCYNILQPSNKIATQNETQEDYNPKHFDDDMLNASGTSCKATWTHKSTLLLIDLYSKYETQFTSTMIKAEAVWKKIATEMKNAGYEFSSSQCKDKMKYMKRCYFKKMDNMGPKSTGSAPIKCEYFEELDNLFGKKPNVKPVSVCSTSKFSCQNIKSR
ncbi:uncharacterized protein LOC105206057 isoform X4 [Solenopsis invicta]|uniref:uncharacterized protein LOC105206057 isoform X4 n=1 Tax=Solenopsis invicta TaxID=13686 RepID=UPI00193DD852|nr:uncharacterized protein LOC105206057 isoform X4 [Solenopsis invicta]